MFSNEVIVKGNYVSGTIKSNSTSKDPDGHPYLLHSGLNLGSNRGTVWNSEKLREIADELQKIAIEIDKHNSETNVTLEEDFSGCTQYTGKVTPSRGIVTDHIIGGTSIGVILDRLKGKEIKISVIE
ncbi:MULTISPECIES: hypothetical protein [Paenibacillus]|uniref:hypothetical protein n=1 Tax=Paenibacillus TaxID=44249 RepID=UPI000B82CFCD|nr:hypothetical protein [Paenibacillus amylolyticus]